MKKIIVLCIMMLSLSSTAFAKNEIIVDRIVGKYAVCEMENGIMKNIKLTKFTSKPKEGDVVETTSKGKYKVNKSKTKSRKNSISKIFNCLLTSGGYKRVV